MEPFDRNAYDLLGVSVDIPCGETLQAFNRAKQESRAEAGPLATARQELANPDKRLALDVFALLPIVPDAVLAAVVSADPGDLPANVDLVDALLLLPEVDLPFRSARPPELAPRHDLAAQDVILQPELE